jgi:hypothetical protein
VREGVSLSVGVGREEQNKGSGQIEADVFGAAKWV